MDKAARYAVIMAGGKGERFWPLSTGRTPKQVLSLFGGKPLIAWAVEYLDGLVPPEQILVITSCDLVEPICRYAPVLRRENVIGEPVGRDTAAAIALGAVLVRRRNPDAVFSVLTADHLIRETGIFQRTLADAMDLAAREDVLLTLGIRPTYAATGYGYMEVEGDAQVVGRTRFRRVRQFREKPDAATAETYLHSGRHFWNAGIFAWSVRSFLGALARHEPELHRAVNGLPDDPMAPDFATRLAGAYAGLKKISVDYAVMEKSSNIRLAEADFGWADVGSWLSVGDHFPADAAGNVAIGTCEALESTGNIVVSEGRLTALIGVRDLVVVHAAGATLVCPRDRVQDVKRMVQQLGAAGRYGHLL